MTEALDGPATDRTLPVTTGSLARTVRRSSPVTAALAVVSSLAVAPHASAAQHHTVLPGETVSQIALEHGSTTAAISRANRLDSEAHVWAGQVLRVPAAGAGARSSSRADHRTTHAPQRTHRVVAGDTVSQIALRYGSTVAAIVAANDLGPRALIRIGDRLVVPTSARTHAGATTQHTSRSTPSQPVGSTFAGRTYASSVVAAANANKASLEASPAPSHATVRRLVVAAAQAHHVSPSLALAVAYQESGFDQRAVSPANAVGIMQVTPAAADWAEMLTGRDYNLLSPEDNVEAGVVLLARLLATSASTDQAIASYYQGQTSVRRYGMFTDTRAYVASVRALSARF